MGPDATGRGDTRVFRLQRAVQGVSHAGATFLAHSWPCWRSQPGPPRYEPGCTGVVCVVSFAADGRTGPRPRQIIAVVRLTATRGHGLDPVSRRRSEEELVPSFQRPTLRLGCSSAVHGV